MVNKKDRRHSGRIISVIYNPKDNPYEETYWNDWIDYRDGFRFNSDKSLIRNKNASYSGCFNIDKYNKKNKKMLIIRKKKICKKVLKNG
jgi:hypothetical protein